MCPAITVMRPVISYLQKKDQADIFAEPVSAEDVSDCVCLCVRACVRACVCRDSAVKYLLVLSLGNTFVVHMCG